MLRRRASGQAMVELLPAVMLFMMVLTASLAYFRGLRAATIRQEVVRNLAFAKIDNMGTLTSSTATGGSDIAIRGPDGLLSSSGIKVSTGGNQSVDASALCFVVSPAQTTKTVGIERVIAAQGLPGLEMTTFAVVYRLGGKSCIY